MAIEILVLAFLAFFLISVIVTIIMAMRLKAGRARCGELAITMFLWILTGITLIANLTISLPP